jgi:YbbR domain-containing protein
MTISGWTIPLSRADLWRLGASLVLAIILWGTITAANNPERSKTFPTVDIAATHLDSSLQIVGSLPQASIALSGPRTDMTKIISSNVTASLDMKNIHAPGDYRLAVDVDHPGSVWKTTVSPSTVLVHVDKTASKEFPLDVRTVGSTGSNQQVGAITPTINTVTVKGPAGEVDAVAKVVASIQIGNQSSDFTDSFTPVAIDANGDPLPNVQVSPGTVPINVQITARGKNVAVITQLIGEPAPGYEVVDRTINPSTVIVDGPADVLATLISVSTEPVDVTNATNTLQKQVKLVGLPDGVKVIDPADGTVAVVVQIAERGVRQPLPSQDVNVVNVGSGLTAEVSPRAVSVTVVASDATIAKLTASDVIVQVNAAGLGPGTYSLSPIVALPSSISWVSTDPPMVTVTIKASTGTTPAAPATPGSTPVSTPVANASPSPSS